MASSTSVLLPEPLVPTMPTRSPAATSREKPRSTGSSLRDGYANVTSLKLMGRPLETSVEDGALPRKSLGSSSLISTTGFASMTPKTSAAAARAPATMPMLGPI